MADYLNIAGRVRTTASDGVAMEAQEVKDLNQNKSQQEINADVQTELGDRYTKEETYSKEQLDDLITTPDVNYVSVVATDATTAVTDVLPATGEADTIYRVGNWNGTQYDSTMYALFAWNGTTYVCLAVRSFVGEVYDISANHPDGQGNPTPYADLAAALGTDGANIPADIRRGGMSIKFVHTSDNKYVQYRLMAQNFTADTTQWQGVSDGIIAGSLDLVKSEDVEESISYREEKRWERKTISIDGEHESESDNRVCSDYLMIENISYIFPSPEIKYTLRCWNRVGEYIDYVNWESGTKVLSDILPQGTFAIRVVAAYIDDRNIVSVSDIANSILFGLTVKYSHKKLRDDSYVELNNVCESGSISVNTGDNETDSLRARSKDFAPLTDNIFIKVAPNNDVSFRFYDENHNYLGYTTTWISSSNEELPLQNVIINFVNLHRLWATNAKYFKVVFKHTDGSSISNISDFKATTIRAYKCSIIGDRYFDDLENTKDSISRVYESIADTNNTIVNEITNIKNEFTSVEWEIGTLNYNDGSENPSTNRVRTDYIVYQPGMKIRCSDGYKIILRAYTEDEASTFISYDYDWIEGNSIDIDNYLPINTVFIRLVGKYSDDRDINDASDFSDKIQFYSPLDEDNSNLVFCSGYIDRTTGEMQDLKNIAYTSKYLEISDIESLVIAGNYLITLRYYDENLIFIPVENYWKSTTDIPFVENAKYIRILVKYSDGHTLTDSSLNEFSKHIRTILSFNTKENVIKLQEKVSDIFEIIEENTPYNAVSSLGNVSIQCAKEHTFDDGTPTIAEWFLLEEAGTNRFFYSKDLNRKTYLFTFNGNTTDYTFGILSNGDIIAVRWAASIIAPTQSDSNRTNPFVFKASEKWSIQHEVDFGNNLKPCGWLENCGFTNLPDGTTMFGEYTRPTVETSNVWKISGDPLNANNWSIVKTFTPVGGDGEAVYKHIHCVTVDFFTGIVYCTTGDHDDYSQIWYTSDGGSTWIEIPKNISLNNGQQYRLLQMTFTESAIIWATDTPGLHSHIVYKGERGNNGVLDNTTISLLCDLTPQDGNFSSYGQAYLPEYNCVFLYDRQDGGGSGPQATKMPLRVVDLDNGNISVVGWIESVHGNSVGFRTKYSEFYPVGGVMRIGFGFESRTYNYNKVCGNIYSGFPKRTVNSLILRISKDSGVFHCNISTFYV